MIRVTLFLKPDVSTGPPVCWQIEGGRPDQHGQADDANAAWMAAHESEICRLGAEAEQLRADLAKKYAEMKRVRDSVRSDEIPL